MPDPSLFVQEFVHPAIELFRRNIAVKHLAVHAISQLDVLAEVVALTTLLQGRDKLPKHEMAAYRDALGVREPAIAVIRDAHDSHKHGELSRRTAVKLSQGQRPQPAVRHAFVLGRSALNRPLKPFRVLVYMFDDGSRVQVLALISDALEAWRCEFERLGLSWPASPKGS